MITTNDLIQYMEELLTSLKDDTLSDETKRELTLLYVKKMYQQNNETEDDKNLSYLSLGWYIQNFLIKKVI